MQSPTTNGLSPVGGIQHTPTHQYEESDSDSDLSLSDYKDHLIEQHQSKMPHLRKNELSISTLSLPLSDGLDVKRQSGLSHNGEVDGQKTPLTNDLTNIESVSSDANLSRSTGSVRRKPPPNLTKPEDEEIGTNKIVTNEPKVDSSTPTATHGKSGKWKRFSTGKINDFGKMMSSLKRSTSMKAVEVSETEDHTYRKPPDSDPVLQAPTFESPSYSTAGETKEMPFWKYHILRFGKDLYLTTNPGTKYVHCRNGPSFYVEVVIDQNLDSKGEEYTLVFKDPGNLSQDPRHCMVISKQRDEKQGYFNLRTPKNTYLADDGTVEKYEDLTMFKSVSFPLLINRRYFPYDSLREENPSCFTNYEIKDLLNRTWNVGSIPRVRTSRFNKVRQSVRNASKEISERSDQEELKLVGKRNVYFHRNYNNEQTGSEQSKISDANMDFPPVLSMFRPNENRTAKRVVQSMKQQQKSRHVSSVHTTLDDFDSTQNDTKSFYNGSDGLYYLQDNRDDRPDENKLGWITIYEDAEMFKGLENRGMFDVVLGMTLAVGFDTYLKNHLGMKR